MAKGTAIAPALELYRFARAADYKGPVRCEVIAQGYNIVVNIGDQPSDLAGGCAEKIFLLPKPFYRIP